MRSRSELWPENAFLRQWLILLERQNPRPKITTLDCLKWLFLAWFLPYWRNLLRIVQPETLLRWHRELFKSFWKEKSGTHPHPKRISEEMLALMRQMADIDFFIDAVLFWLANCAGEEIAAGVGTEIIYMPFYTPPANGHCERLMGSIKHECFDHMFSFHEQQVRRVMKDYTAFCNTARPHQGMRQRIPAKFIDGSAVVEKGGRHPPVVTPFLKGLHHSYSWTSRPV
jgi:hypothetical protein